jgi:predicted transcriptional regulator
MHLRLVRTKSGGKERRYAQLVESFRRPDGVPAHRVIASLGTLSDLEIANLRTALEASRQGKTVVVLGTDREAESAADDREQVTTPRPRRGKQRKAR